MYESLIAFDRSLFQLINRSWGGALDALFTAFRWPYFWLPLYLFIVYSMFNKYKRKGWLLLFVVLLIFVITDQISAHVVKPYFMRLRPCNDPLIKDSVHLLVPCGSGFSFVSTHATNHFGLSTVLALMLFKTRKQQFLLFLWAFLVAIAQVHVGVHYPIDVFLGALLGIIISYTLSVTFNKFFHIN